MRSFFAAAAIAVLLATTANALDVSKEHDEIQSEVAKVNAKIDAMTKKLNGEEAEADETLPSGAAIRAELSKDDFVTAEELDAWRTRRYQLLRSAAEKAGAAVKRATQAKEGAAEAMQTANSPFVAEKEQKAVEVAEQAIERARAVEDQAHMREFMVLHGGKAAESAEEAAEEVARIDAAEEKAAAKMAEGDQKAEDAAGDEELAAASGAEEKDSATAAATGSAATGAAGTAGEAPCSEEKIAAAIEKMQAKGELPAPAQTPAEMIRNVVEQERMVAAVKADQVELAEAHTAATARNDLLEAAKRRAELRAKEREIMEKRLHDEAKLRAENMEEMMDAIRSAQKDIRSKFGKQLAQKIRAIEEAAAKAKAKAEEAEKEEEKEAERQVHERQAEVLAKQAEEERRLAAEFSATGLGGHASMLQEN